MSAEPKRRSTRVLTKGQQQINFCTVAPSPTPAATVKDKPHPHDAATKQHDTASTVPAKRALEDTLSQRSSTVKKPHTDPVPVSVPSSENSHGASVTKCEKLDSDIDRQQTTLQVADAVTKSLPPVNETVIDQHEPVDPLPSPTTVTEPVTDKTAQVNIDPASSNEASKSNTDVQQDDTVDEGGKVDRVTSAKEALTGESLPGSSATPRMYMLESDKTRIAEEQYILEKLHEALDMSLNFHLGHNRVAFYHKIEPMLRNTTRKNITLAHVSKILYLAPELYDIHPRIVKEFGRTIEAYILEFGKQWIVPLSGKDAYKRKTMLSSRIQSYFEAHKEPSATIPEKPLPKIEKVVDKAEWLRQAELPSGIKSILEIKERRRKDAETEAEQKQQGPRPLPKGNVKERGKALLERLRARQKANEEQRD
ncbi:uncharacterized protein BYT42DRAFT_541801 [Radiomyces spectabilis]|uniref:uncharacterized protein n=1 Tax=Radiomyces spectabilis TaxID=64574 RepID=UPI00221EB45C|nr:uncharacterized protein BYT42DRAFT_541801 [Radiomyces spectabilis]KAI8393549.1 hypothetical protein BYT42DRAFT_541801 [Radiomyces spectabilis]